MNNDLISRSALEKEISEFIFIGKSKELAAFNLANGSAIDCVRSAPAVDAAPVGCGEWNGWTTSAYIGPDEDGEPKVADRKYYRCSECRYGTVVRSNYCPSCGALMKGGE